MKPKDFLYGRKGPWPQPCPDHPYGESPGVIHLPLGEWIDWWAHVGLRYMTQWPFFTPIYFIEGLLNPGCKDVSDAEFHEYLTNSMMSRFITPKLDEIDKSIFKDYIKAGETYFITDLEAVRTVKTFKGQFVSPTKTLLKNIGENQFEIVCIYVDKTKTILTHTEGEAWDLAKYFVLQGGAICATLVVHPLLHFPLDCINAITKTALPKKHILFKLLYAHLRFTLPLENAVLNFKMSLLHPDGWWKTYAPYPGPYDGIRDLLVEGYKGIKNNDSYPPYEYPRRPPKIYSNYGVFLDAYYETIYKFVDDVLKEIPRNDQHVKNWANYICQWLPGFPDGEEIFEGKTFTEVVAFFIWDVTVGHTIDHYNFSQMDIRKVPLRLRQAPPEKGTKIKSRKKLQTANDLMRYKLAMRLFFGPTVVTKFIDVKYDFNSPHLLNRADRFIDELKQTEKDLKQQGLDYIPLDDIARTIQF